MAQRPKIALLLSAMCGPDPDRDSTSLTSRRRLHARALNDRLTACASASRRNFWRRPGGDVRAAVDAALKPSTKTRRRLVPDLLPRTELSIPVYYIIAPAEASVQPEPLRRRAFGHRAADYATWPTCTSKTRAEGFGDEVKRRIMIGTYVLSTATTTPTTCRRRRSAA